MEFYISAQKDIFFLSFLVSWSAIINYALYSQCVSLWYHFTWYDGHLCFSYEPNKEKRGIYKPHMLLNVSHSDTDVFEHRCGLYVHIYVYKILVHILIVTYQF